MIDLSWLDREVAFQLWILFIMAIGFFGMYFAHKYSNKNPITKLGILKKIIIVILAWLIQLSLLWEPLLRNLSHIDVIAIALPWGISAEVIVGKYLQPLIEKNKELELQNYK